LEIYIKKEEDLEIKSRKKKEKEYAQVRDLWHFINWRVQKALKMKKILKNEDAQKGVQHMISRNLWICIQALENIGKYLMCIFKIINWYVFTAILFFFVTKATLCQY
jgi:hypothetical protein